MRSEYEELYSDADYYFVINNGDGIEGDDDLKPIYISLPRPPKDKTKIKNYGLHPKDQVYVPDKMPSQLVFLMEDATREAVEKMSGRRDRVNVKEQDAINIFWRKLGENPDYYEESLQFIRESSWKSVYGEWVYIHGKPTYIPPWYYDYLNFYYMKLGDGSFALPEFRKPDLEAELFDWYIYNCTEVFADLDDDGRPIKDDRGVYRMKDIGYRVFFGVIPPKNRRRGETHRAISAIWSKLRLMRNGNGVFLSKSITDMEKHFRDKFIPAWQRQPLFRKPLWLGDNIPANALVMNTQDLRVEGLNTTIYYPPSVGETVIDSQQVDMVLLDEQGKPTGGGRVDVFERWETTKHTMSQGDGAIISGFCFAPSTAEEIDADSGNYQLMCSQSDFYSRQVSGQTKSGLALRYMPSQYGLEGFIDPWGNPVVGDPTEEQIIEGKKHGLFYASLGIGARQYVLGQLDSLRSSSSPADKKKYYSLKRKYPTRYADVWSSSRGDMGWDIEAINRRLTELNRLEAMHKPVIKRGYLRWVGGRRDTQVEWVSDPHGRFEMAYDAEDRNKKNMNLWVNPTTGEVMETWEPVIKGHYTMGVDPFEYGGVRSALKTTMSYQSDGGIAILREYDPLIDGDKKNILEWETRIFVLSYRYRPETLMEFVEDVIMAAVYYGAMIYIERNLTRVWEEIVSRGYGGYLIYDVDKMTGRPATKPGYYASVEMQNVMLMETKDYIKNRIHKEKFVSYMKEIKKISNRNDLTKNDRFVAHGAALMGSRTNYGVIADRTSHQSINIAAAGRFAPHRI